MGTNGNWRGTMPSPGGRAAWRRGVVTPPYGCNAGGAWQRADVPKAWLPPTKFRAEIWGASHGHRPLRGDGEVSANTRASGAQRSVCGAVARDGWELRQRSSPKGAATSDNPSVALRAPAPFTQGSLWGRGMRIAASALRASSQWQWFSVIPRPVYTLAVGIRPFYDGRGFGPPYLGHGLRRPNFGTKFGASVKSSAPTGGCRELPRPPGQRSERGKRSWSNSIFARCPLCSARRTGFGSLRKAPPVLPLVLP